MAAEWREKSSAAISPVTVRWEPNVSVFNAFNFANFGGAGNQLSGVLNGAPATSLNNASLAPPKIKLKIESLSTL
jgi:hypothetical protein